MLIEYTSLKIVIFELNLQFTARWHCGGRRVNVIRCQKMAFLLRIMTIFSSTCSIKLKFPSFIFKWHSSPSSPLRIKLTAESEPWKCRIRTTLLKKAVHGRYGPGIEGSRQDIQEFQLAVGLKSHSSCPNQDWHSFGLHWTSELLIALLFNTAWSCQFWRKNLQRLQGLVFIRILTFTVLLAIAITCELVEPSVIPYIRWCLLSN